MYGSLIASIVVSWAVAFYVWRRRPAPGAKILTLMMLLIGWWGIPFLLRALDSGAKVRLIALKMEYISIISVPTLWLWFALVYTHQKAWLSPWRLALLTLIPCITLLLALTAENHNLIVDFSETPLNMGGPEYAHWKRGIWGWINTYYQYGILAIGTVVLLRGVSALHLSYRSQIIPLVITVIVAWGINILYTLDLIPPQWPIAPLSFAFFGLGVTWSLYRHHLLDLVPVARNMLVERMHDAVFVLDTQKRIVDINPAGQHLLDQPPHTLIGQPIDQVLPNLANLLHAQANQHRHKAIVRPNAQGERQIYDASVSTLQNQHSQTTGYLCALRDVTELEDAREQAQLAARAKSEFLSNVSHELRTPLASAKLYLHLLQSGKQEKQEAYMASICREVERLQTLIEGVLTISRLDLGKLTANPREVDVNTLVQSLYQDRHLLFEEQNVTLTLETATHLPPVNADPQLIEQVLTNLLTNALNYTLRGGVVDLCTAQQATDPAWVTITIRDTGLGIPVDEQAHIFERFQRGSASQVTKTPGTGLGLAICQEIVQLHHGRITVDSEEGEGSTFTIWLPVRGSF